MTAADLISLFVAYRRQHGHFPLWAHMASDDIESVDADLSRDAWPAHVVNTETQTPSGSYKFTLLGVKCYPDALVAAGKPELM